MSAVIPLHTIVDFFGVEASCMIKKGENLRASNHLKDFIFNAECHHIQAKVHASQKKTVYNVRIELDNDFGIESATCDCVRGRGRCGHMACTLLHARDNISRTEGACRWTQRAEAASSSTATIDEDIYKKPAYMTDYNVIDNFNEMASFSRLREELQECEGAGAGALFLLEDEPNVPYKDLLTPGVEEIVLSESYQEAPDKVVFLQQVFGLAWGDIEMIAEATIGQTSNNAWTEIRHCRITASRFGAVLQSLDKKGGGPPAPSLLKSLYYPKSLEQVHSIQWGVTHEPHVFDLFQEVTGKVAKKTGLWLDETGLLGASPDGLVGDTEVLEIKCPYKFRNDDLQTVLALPQKEGYILKFVNGEWVVNKQHSYFAQIQGQLFLTRRSVCSLAVWTQRSLVIKEIPIDQSWEANLVRLRKFYVERYVPYIQEQHKK